MRTIVILSGAGLSAESGIPTFRDSDGLWEHHKVDDVATPQGWQKNKELVLQFYEARFNSIKNAQPNDAHKAIAALEEKFKVVNITQNIDDLLERAGCTDVYHIHGSINKRRCERHKAGDCTAQHLIEGCCLNPDYNCDYAVEQTEPVKLGDLCPKCNGQMRPDVVWFTEPVDLSFDYIKGLLHQVKYNDGVFITIGTSAQVHPAASLIPFFAQCKHKYIINKEPFRISNYQCLVGSAGERMMELKEELLKRGA